MSTESLNHLVSLTLSQRRGIAAAVLLGWLVMVAGVFWFTNLQYRSVWYTFDGSAWQTPPATTAANRTVIHFVDEDCPCTRYSLPHIEKLEARFPGVNFQRVAPGTEATGLSQSAVPASPAVAVWNPQGELEYFGPYSSGALCGEGEDLLSPFLRGERQAGQWTNQEAIGCFCAWPRTNMTVES